MKIGNALRECREKKGLDRKEVAKILEVSTPTLAHYENNDNEPNFDTLRKMAELYDVSMSEFFGEKPKVILSKATANALLDSALEMLKNTGMLEEVEKFEDLDEDLKQIVYGALNKVIKEKKSTSI